MLFMVQWYTHPDKRAEVYRGWVDRTAEERADLGPGLKMVGRWHNIVEASGVLIVEAESEQALMQYVTPWSLVMELEVAPVVDDEGSAAALEAAMEGL